MIKKLIFIKNLFRKPVSKKHDVTGEYIQNW